MPRRERHCLNGMSEHERHTEFLRQCLLYDESDARQKLEKGITQIQRDARCVRRAVWLMALLSALAVTGLSYGVLLVDNFLYNTPKFIINFIAALGFGSLISLLAFVGLGRVYRMKLDRRRDECRHLVTRLLESRLGKPVATPVPDPRGNRPGEGDRRNDPVGKGGNGSQVNIESAAGE